MICNKCGMQVEENSQYCPNCGNIIERINNDNNVYDSSNFNPTNNANINTQYNEVNNTYSNYQNNINKNIVNDNQIQNLNKRKFDWKTPLILFILSILSVPGFFVIKIIISFSLKQEYFKYEQLLSLIGFAATIILFISSIVVLIIKIVKYSNPNSKTTNQYNNEVINSNMSLDDKLLMAYVGDNYFKIKNNKFSVPSFFLNYLYTSYRKYYLLTFIIFLILTISAAFNDVIFNIIYIVMDVIIAINFNKWYLKDAKKRIQKIKNDNSNANENDLIMLCSKKGKPSIGISIICLLIYSLIVGIIRSIIGV